MLTLQLSGQYDAVNCPGSSLYRYCPKPISRPPLARFSQALIPGGGCSSTREQFLEEMETVVPWAELIAVIEPHYPTAGRGRRPRGLETMVRMYFMQHWFNLSDPGMEDALCDIACMRAFAKLELFDESMPDETTILKFRRVLEARQLTAAIMNTINEVLEQKGLPLKGGTMVDATIIHAPPPTKNESKQRDPEMRQTKKGNQWYFGMKIHVRADVESGLAHTVSVTSANAPDGSQLPKLLREEDRAVLGDKGVCGQPHQACGTPSGRVLGRGAEVERAAQAD